ncbi:MAG: LytTR family DNA-binding domain-containing protein [Myxococcota bacterium]
MKLRVLIVDDEELARLALMDLFALRTDVEVVGEADTVSGAARAITRCEPDVVFLDVTLADGEAFELFARRSIDAQVVFLTASEAHAVRAFEVDAVDYLLKPTQPEDLDRALDRVLRGRAAPKPGATPRLRMDDLVYLREAQHLRRCRVSEIVLIRAAGDYTEVQLTNGSVALIHRRLRAWVEELPGAFVQCHRSTLVNLDYLEALDSLGGTTHVRLATVEGTLRVSRRFAASFKERVRAFVEA